MPRNAINDVFEQVIVVNLDRRADRLASVATQLQRLGISFQRFTAVDGADPAVIADWQDYTQTGFSPPPRDARPVANWREFYLDYDSELARVAFFEAQRGQPIATAGAWSLLCSMNAILERAVAEGWKSVLILEDDVLFHRDTIKLFDLCIAELPPDWKLLQLGAMQMHWQDDWISWHSDRLYRCQGSSIGAHAFGVRAEVLPELLELSRARNLPFDIGALHAIKRRHASHCFTMFPNLAIQDAADSDIGMSTMFFREARMVDNIYRWYLPDYGPDVIKASDAADEPAFADDAGAEVASVIPGNATTGRWRKLLTRLNEYALKANRANTQVGDTASTNEVSSPPVVPAPRSGGQPPLKVRSLKRPKANAVVTLVVGLSGDELVRVLDILSAQRARSDLEPILVTDSAATELFRARALAFEYLPPQTLQARLDLNLDWEMHKLRRLALLRRKWQPVRILAFGPKAAQLLLQWKNSPFEDDSIHQVAAGAQG